LFGAILKGRALLSKRGSAIPRALGCWNILRNARWVNGLAQTSETL